MRRSYPVLTTDAFILHTRGVGEADRIITALTKGGGLLNIFARSIRREGAKMRGTARPYGYVSLSVVQGKNTILKDIKIAEPLNTVWNDIKKYTALVRLLQYVRTLIPITDVDDGDIFNIVEEAVMRIQRESPDHSENILLIAQVMLLTELGYVSDRNIIHAEFDTIFQNMLSSSGLRNDFARHLQTALQHQ